MRVAIWHNLPSGGGNRALHDQVRGLVARGHHVEIWCPPTANRSFLPLGDIVTEHVVPLDEHRRPAKGRVDHWLKPYRETIASYEAMDLHCQACAAEINAGGFDLLLAHPCVFFRASPIGRHVKLPKVLFLQEPKRELYEAAPRLPWVALPAPTGRPSVSYGKWFLHDLIHVQSLRVQVREELANASARR